MYVYYFWSPFNQGYRHGAVDSGFCLDNELDVSYWAVPGTLDYSAEDEELEFDDMADVPVDYDEED